MQAVSRNTSSYVKTETLPNFYKNSHSERANLGANLNNFALFKLAKIKLDVPSWTILQELFFACGQICPDFFVSDWFWWEPQANSWAKKKSYGQFPRAK
jgi:hypothetical protein